MDQGYQQDGQSAGGSAARMRSIGQTISTWIGAVIAMILLLGLGTWFYNLGVRDAQQVPIIRASTDPVKTRPTDKGGEVTPHQDIASYDAGAAEEAPAPETTLAAPPAAPVEEDVAMAELRPKPKPEVAAEPDPKPEPAPEPETEVLAITEEVPEPAAPAAVTDAAVVEEVEVLEEADPIIIRESTPLPTPEELQAAINALESLPPKQEPASSGNEFAPDYSPVAVRRPANLEERMIAARSSAEEEAEDQIALAENSRIKVQLRASPNRDEIVSSWNRIRRTHSDIVGTKSLVLQLTKSGGQTFYRLRLGPFRDRAEANAVCQALKARDQDCIVTSDG